MLLERNKAFNNDIFRKSINLDKDAKYAEKEDRLLARSLDVISKDARRVTRTMGAEQRNLIRRSTSVQAMTGNTSTKSSKMRPDTPVMPHNMLYGSANTFTSCANVRYSYNQGVEPGSYPPTHSGASSSRYSDNMMSDLRTIANKALSNLDMTKGTGKEKTGDNWSIIKRTSVKEKKNSKADNILQQNISKWHTSFQNSGSNATGDSLKRVRKTGYTAEMNRSISCDLPRINSSSSRSSRRSEPAMSLQKYELYLPNIGK